MHKLNILLIVIFLWNITTPNAAIKFSRILNLNEKIDLSSVNKVEMNGGSLIQNVLPFANYESNLRLK